MKILIGYSEICGWAALIQRELIELGHDCSTIINRKHNLFFDEKYSLVVDNVLIKKTEYRLINGVITRLNNLIEWFAIRLSILSVFKKYDLVIYLWRPFFKSNSDIQWFAFRGTKIIFLFVGSDVRVFKKFSQEFDVSEWIFPPSWTQENEREKIRYVQMAEKYGTLIYSVPDQAGLQKKPYYHLQIPIELKKYTYVNNKRLKPTVLHLPSEPWKKGTDIIEKTLYELQQEGLHFEFLNLRNIPHREIPNLLSNIDILIDEIVFNGPGVLAFEAMASGCAVATRYIDSSPDSFKPPIWNVTAKNIKEKLRILLSDYELQQYLIIEGQKYVSKNNDSKKIIKAMIQNVNTPRVPDYLLST
jgi:glycosyltransferase involved in cell wall biosynthesis